jgi:transcriptional regulator with XRE-family HTH domain
MATVLRWTGREARLLREAMRLSVRAFAVHLGYNDAAVSNWERRGKNARLRTQTQCDLDAALKLADDDARERFSAALASAARADAVPEPLTLVGVPAGVLELAMVGEMDLAAARGEGAGQASELLNSLRGNDEGPGWDRANVLRALLGVSALPLMPPALLTSGHDASEAEFTAGDPRAYAQVTSCYQQLYWASSGMPLLQAAYSHTRLGVDMVRQTAGSGRVMMASGLAESALLTARLALFDLGQCALASSCLRVALAAAQVAADDALTAAVLGHLAFAHAFTRDFQAAQSLADQALRQAAHGVHPLVASWLHCVASEVHVRAGAAGAGLKQIDMARDAFVVDSAPPEWFDFYDSARLDSFAGYAAVASGDHPHAATLLARALDGLGPDSRKQRSVVLADLAAAHAADGDLLADYLLRGVDALQADPYTTGLERIRSVRPLLGDSSHGREVDERVAALTAGRLGPAG